MKRTLLFSATMLAVAGASANVTSGKVAATLSGTKSLVNSKELCKPMVVRDFSKLSYSKNAVKAAKANGLQAGYLSPVGNTFFFGRDISGSSYYPGALLPANYDVTYTNTSKGATEYEWAYPMNKETLYSYDKDLTVNYPLTLAEFPMLTASDGTDQSSYRLADFPTTSGGTAPSYVLYGGNPDLLGVFGEDVFEGLQVENSLEMSTYITMPSQHDGEFWGEFGDCLGYGLAVLQPAVPYVVENIMVSGTISGATDTPITITAYKAVVGETADGETVIQPTDEVLGTATADLTQDVFSYFVEDTNLIRFTFSRKVGELEEIVPVKVDCPVMFILSVPENVTFEPLTCASNTVAASYPNSWAVFKDGVVDLTGFGIKDESGSVHSVTQLDFRLGVIYDWMMTEDDDYEFNAPVAGGSKTFNINTLFTSASWTVEDSQNALYDWVNCEFSDSESENATMTLTVNELPSEVKGRYTVVTLSSVGASAKFTVTQGEAGVEGVETSAVVVSVVDGNFVVKGSNASVVDVYNVAGQKVASAAVDGETVVNAENLAKGMYILKFNDNTAIKVVK